MPASDDSVRSETPRPEGTSLSVFLLPGIEKENLSSCIPPKYSSASASNTTSYAQTRIHDHSGRARNGDVRPPMNTTLFVCSLEVEVALPTAEDSSQLPANASPCNECQRVALTKRVVFVPAARL